MSRFSLRDLFWLTLVVALAVAWLVQTRKLSVAQDRLDSVIAELVSRDCPVEVSEEGIWIGYPPGSTTP